MSTENTHVRDVLSRLKREGASTVTITYDGCGDEGSVQDTIAEASNSVELDLAEVDAVTLADWGESCIEEIHPGWELGEGSYGQFTIDLAAEITTVEHVHYTPTMTADTSTITLDGERADADPAAAVLLPGGREAGRQ